MSDHDRGPYTPPSEPPLAFDPRRPVRGAGPVPVTLIVSALADLTAGKPLTPIVFHAASTPSSRSRGAIAMTAPPPPAPVSLAPHAPF